MANDRLADIRSAIAEINRELQDHDNDVVFAELERRYPELLAEASRDLQRLAFIKLHNDVCGRSKGIATNPAQIEMFGNIRHPELVNIPIYENGKLVGRKRVDFANATIDDLQAWCDHRRAPKSGQSVRYEKIDHLLRRVRLEVQDTTISITEALKIMDERKAAQA